MTDLLTSTSGRLGRITLNRPKTINALTHAMVREMAATLDAWEHDDGIDAVLVAGAGERGLCAGGDIRSIYSDTVSGSSATLEFWADEYRLNARISRYPKPYVVVMDGLVIGGGVGLSAHGDVRVVTERTRVALPEVGIGLVPDVGGTWLLPRMPGESGVHAGLTAAPLSGSDAMYAGLADHYVPSESLPPLVEKLAEAGDLTGAAKIVEEFTASPPPSALNGAAGWIDACYGGSSVEAIVARLREHGEPAAAAAANSIERMSPTALKVTLRALRSAGPQASLWDALVAEYRLSAASLHAHDLREGIRAQIIDKDRDPHWDPPTLADVDDARVEVYFRPPPGGDLTANGREAG